MRSLALVGLLLVAGLTIVSCTSCQYDWQCTSSSQGLGHCDGSNCYCNSPFHWDSVTKKCACDSPRTLKWISLGATCLAAGECFTTDQCNWPTRCVGGTFPSTPGVCQSVSSTPAATTRAPTTPVAPVTWNVVVGTEQVTPTINNMGMGFYPSSLTVRQGDIVRFALGGMEVHTVTFGAAAEIQLPLIPSILFAPIGTGVFNGINTTSSGLMFPGSVYNVVMNAPPGTYKYRCTLHPAQVGYITVVAGANPDTPAAATQRGAAEMQADLQQGLLMYRVSQTELTHPLPAIFGAPAPSVQVVVGAGNGRAAVMSFIPNNITIPVGQTIRFVNRDPYTPHTVTFGPTVDPFGELQTATSPVTFDGTTPFNSGFLWPAGVPGTASFYDVTFSAAGTFEIYCAPHHELGMEMFVTVA